MRLLRVSSTLRTGYALAIRAMHEAGEPAEVPARLAHGDEFFGWIDDCRVVCFGWVCYADRRVGLYHYPDEPEQAFLYNFHTDPTLRGRGLYPALLLQMRYQLSRQGRQHFMIDVRVDNLASIRGITKAGFAPLRRVGFDTWLGVWRRELVLG